MDGLMIKYFVLKPHGDRDDQYARASRAAMRRYAKVIAGENPSLASDLVSWADKEYADQFEDDGIECDHSNAAPHLQADPTPVNGDLVDIPLDICKAFDRVWDDHRQRGISAERACYPALQAALRVTADVFENAIRAESDNSECTDNFVSAVRARIFPQPKTADPDEAIKDLLAQTEGIGMGSGKQHNDAVREAYRRGQQSKEAK